MIKREKTQITNVKSEREPLLQTLQTLKRIISEYYAELYANKFNNFIAITGIEFFIKNFPQRKLRPRWLNN